MDTPRPFFKMSDIAQIATALAIVGSVTSIAWKLISEKSKIKLTQLEEKGEQVDKNTEGLVDHEKQIHSLKVSSDFFREEIKLIRKDMKEDKKEIKKEIKEEIGKLYEKFEHLDKRICESKDLIIEKLSETKK